MAISRIKGLLLAGGSVLIISGAALAQQNTTVSPETRQQGQGAAVGQGQPLGQDQGGAVGGSGQGQGTGGAQGDQQLSQGQSQGGAQLGVSPAQVRQVQQALNQAGYDTGAVDGVWGPQSQAALANFQQAQGLEPTGQINQTSLQTLGLSGAGAQGQTGIQGQTGRRSGREHSAGRAG